MGPAEKDNHFLVLPIDFGEFSFALRNVNKNSAPGFNKINYIILEKLPEFVKRVILDIYNDILYTGCFPDQWKKYLCFFIPKANSDKVRPISMSSCFLKLLEKNLNERLTVVAGT
ncbi:hypothetical protein ALC60_01312 [Trachymyrmex zeteki]|uniref:RNA-directed DNA polymerase from mobile element jockey n=1 Tax=Mycetomoellerius zeteki TaxID=64791 RepID=A0A151XGX1_9HYME|nr:hypothetical protein ALC60_01312 [Trachymyrmex zeteki]